MRKAEGLTQSELAEEVYTDVGSINRYELGVYRLAWHKFLEIARTLGYEVEISVKGGAE